ncbi:hypothetical protein CO641_02315 [Lysobacteraceae bacterium NML91-0213]|nr:hypothetical protein CO641_02315 [Xanthomonadaceae bacterium NML91-0213]
MEDVLARCVAEAIENGDGFWQPCSGCYETSDGYNVQGFPYSTTFRCNLGGGCFECGGLGAVWIATPDDDQRSDDTTQPRTDADAAQQGEVWRPMETAPRDGTMVRLLVKFDKHATEDTAEPAWTIGANNDDNVGDDEHAGWQFAGWCWTHDHFTEGKGTPVGWLPMLATAPPSAPVGVERKYPDDGNGDDDAYNRGWNDCRDALAQQPAAAPFVCTGDEIRCHDGNGCECAMQGKQPAADRDIEADALQYVFGNMDRLDWARIVDEQMTPPWPLPHHVEAMGMFKQPAAVEKRCTLPFIDGSPMLLHPAQSAAKQPAAVDEDDAEPAEPCESALPDCGPAIAWDSEGCGACERCAKELGWLAGQQQGGA